MFQTMTVHQLEFFDEHNGSEDDRKMLKFKRWLAQGKIDTVTYMDMKTGKTSWAARLRGVRVTGTFPTSEEAEKKAEKIRKQFEKEADREIVDLDSKALLIDGESYAQSQKYDDIHIERFIHLGIELANGMNDHRFSDALEDFVDHICDKSSKPFGKLQKLQDALSKIDDDEDDCKDDYIREAFSDSGFFGVAIQVHTPIKKFCGTGSSCSYSWGSTYYKWVYGENLEDALSEAKKWADGMAEADKKAAQKKKVTKKVAKKKTAKKKVTKK